MKILYLTIDRSNMVVSHFENWQQALSKVFDVDFIIKDITGYKTGKWCKLSIRKEIPYEEVVLEHIRNTDKQYDWIITDASFGFCHEHWNKIKIPKAMITEDAWGENINLIMDRASDEKWDIIFYKCKEAWLTQQKKYVDKFDCRWLPHSVNLDMFKDYKLPKKRECIVTGALHGIFYTARHEAWQILKDEPYFERILRAKDDGVEPGWPNGEDYSKLLNESKISITGGAKYNVVFMKHLEIPASKCLLMSNWYSDLEELGFKRNENIIEMDMSDLKNQVQSLLYDDDYRNEITENGYNFVRKNHSCDARAKQMKEELLKW